MLSYGSNVIGVAPEIYKADLLLFLPGGTGTFEELITALETKDEKK